MKIKSLQLKNFKRFTDLTLQDIPENAKLVLLIGSNGSGKSSVFDAFTFIHNRLKKEPKGEEFSEYYRKNKNAVSEVSISFDNIDDVKLPDNAYGDLSLSNKIFYGRTSFRQIPRLTKTALGQNNYSNQNRDFDNESDRPKFFIDRDNRFENDVEKITETILKDFFRSQRSNEEIRERYINPINQALLNIFGDSDATKLNLLEIIPPLEGKIAQINFKKGNSEIHYNYLSAGEKEVFNILINLLSRSTLYQDTIYFFDEIDLHLNTKLQYSLLKEIVENWIPDTCQFWTASHSLGFIQYATDYENGCIIDFDDLDFDKKQVLTPKQKDDLEIFEIAVSKAFIDQVVQGRKIIFSENSDTPFYNDLNLKDILFFVALDKMDVFHKAKNHKQFGLIDRDYLSDDEVVALRKDYPNLYILPYYSFENLLYHPDNLLEYYSGEAKSFDRERYINEITKIKNDERDYLAAGIIQARSGYPFYKENENAKMLKQFRDNYKKVIELLRSDDFETFYKVFPAKDYGKEVTARQIPVTLLSKTKWFKNQIEKVIA